MKLKPLFFTEICYSFNEYYFKIESDKIFIEDVRGGEPILLTKGLLIHKTKHLQCRIVVEKERRGETIEVEKTVSFIKEWLKWEKMRTYKSRGCFPNPVLCPRDCFNTWRPFKFSS